MLTDKCIRIVRQGGIGALYAKASNRIKYRHRAAEYMRVNGISAYELAKQKAVVYPHEILLSIVVPLYNTPEIYLREMLQSVLKQSYKNWELCLADASDDDSAARIISEYADKRIKYKRLEKNFGIAENTNLAAETASGEYIGLLDHDDVISPDLLFECRKYIDHGADFIYCDEASFTSDIQKPSIIHFKPDYSPYNLRGNNYICHFTMFKKSLFDEAGGFRKGFDGSQDHDLMLRLTEKAEHIAHIPKPLYYWRMHKNSVASDISAKPYCINSAVLAVSQQLLRLKTEGTVESIGSGAAVYRCNYKVRGKGSCRTVRICSNRLLDGCLTDFIAVIPDGIELEKKQICRLISLVNLDGVGAAGGIGVYRGRVSGGGVRFVGNGTIEIAFDGESLSSGGYMHRMEYVQNINALNLFAVFSREAFEEAGGFDEELKMQERLIDLCIRLAQNNYDILLDPEVRAKALPDMSYWEMSIPFAKKHTQRLLTEDEYISNDLADYTQ